MSLPISYENTYTVIANPSSVFHKGIIDFKKENFPKFVMSVETHRE